MDEVDYRYKDSIKEALQTGNINKLMELVPSIDEQEAQDYMKRWQQNYLDTMKKIRMGLDTSDLEKTSYEIANDLMNKASLSGYKR